MKNVTITISDTVYERSRVNAAKNSKSLSRFISELLEQQMPQSEEATSAMDGFVSKPPYQVQNKKTYAREEIYDRSILR